MLLLGRMLWLAARVGVWLLLAGGLRRLGLKTPGLTARLVQRLRQLGAEARSLGAECWPLGDDADGAVR